MKLLPLGVQHFDKLIQDNCVYVDKTQLIHQLTTTGQIYFLSRPRRFGKSLLVSTLKHLFQGNKILFKDLWIEDKWDWSKTHPIIHLSFAVLDFVEDNLAAAISERLHKIAGELGVVLTKKTYKSQFEELIELLYKKSKQQVVILIDEYDKPIVQYLEYDTMGQAEKNQKILKNFYSALKDAGAMIRFLFITGVSKFSKVSLFSDLNHMTDLTMRATYAALTGYTQAELTHYFDDYLKRAVAVTEMPYEQLLAEMHAWYDGYSWDGKTWVYNPFGTLQFLSEPEFRNYWFESGTPTFLIHQMKRHGQFQLENIWVEDGFLEKYDLDNVAIIPLLFQTGYLTVKEKNKYPVRYRLDFPNKEVRESMYRFILDELAPNPLRTNTGMTVEDLKLAFETNNLVRVRAIITSVLADLPHDTFKDGSEGLYHGVIHILFQYLGATLQSEVHSSIGRADTVVQTPTHVYIFEFKIKESADAALRQIVRNRYADKYRASNKPILAIGVKFNPQNRSIESWRTKKL
jgi:Predicted AAA-ATPase/PD-(D/E)XK nuclease superfamily